MVRKTGQIIRRGPSTWLVRIYVGRDPESHEVRQEKMRRHAAKKQVKVNVPANQVPTS